MTTEARLYKLEGIVEGVMATLPGQVASLEGRIELFRQEVKAEIGGLRQEVKAEINPAFNKLMLYFTALAAALAILTFLR